MNAEQYIRRMQRNMAGSIIVIVATIINVIAGLSGTLPIQHFLYFSIMLFGCSCLTIYWNHRDKRYFADQKTKK